MKLITPNFKVHSARQFMESFTETANTIYYMTAHKSTPFTDDNSPTAPATNLNYTNYQLYDDVLFGKHIISSDTAHMVARNDWVSDTVYDMYDDKVENLESKNFFVVIEESSNYHIFKCLNNNGGVPSTDKPLFSETSAEDEQYVTNDGYSWKYMYTIPNVTYDKFSTDAYVPVVINSDVTANATLGTLDSIIVEGVGANYNSYAAGTIKESAVSGNNMIYSLNGNKYADALITLSDVTGFQEEKVTSLRSDGKTASAVVVEVYDANNTIKVTNSQRRFEAGGTITGNLTTTSSTIVSTNNLTSELSANNNFYNNSAFYIRSGAGAGQIRNILNYSVTGDERRILLDSPFDVIPDTSSVYEISPRVIINGDGSGASAIVTVNPSSNTVAEVEIIASGSDYTYANIEVVANTGLINLETNESITTSSADLRSIISPFGGHGYDVVNELYANKVGISVNFANTESGTIPAENDFRKIGILKEPQFANTELTLESSYVSESFTAGEIVTQSDTGASGTVMNRSGLTLRLGYIRGFFASGNSSVNILTGGTSGYTAEVDATDRTHETFDNRETYQVEMQYTGTGATGFVEDELVVQEGLSTLAGNIIKLSVSGSAYIYTEGESLTQTNTGATGTVIDRSNGTVVLGDTSGYFLTGNTSTNTLESDATSANSVVEAVDSTFQAKAIGNIHSLDAAGANTAVISLTDVKGHFSLSDNVTGDINTFTGQESGAICSLTGRAYDKNYLISDKGEFLYVEHFSPITRTTSQTETVKIVVEF